MTCVKTNAISLQNKVEKIIQQTRFLFSQDAQKHHV